MGATLFLAIVLLLLLGLSRSAVLLLLRRYGVSRISRTALLAKAEGRTILLGERHDDRDGLYAALSLMRAADAAGYHTLGVEVCEDSDGDCSGMREELEAIRRIGHGEMPEHDERSSLDLDRTGMRSRMNRYWHMRVALQLGWTIVPIDPYHWNWRSETPDGYLYSREPAMAEAIRGHRPMVAVCGYGHMHGLYRMLGNEVVYAVVSKVRSSDVPSAQDFWADRIAFAAELPHLLE